VRWDGKIAAGSTSDRACGFEDWLPTFLELIGAKDAIPAGLDGVTFAPTLLGRKQTPRALLYRESPGYGGQQCVRVGDWKALRRNLNPLPKAKDQKPGEIELYNLAQDPREQKDAAGEHPEVVKELSALMEKQHVKSALWPMRALDGAQ
jgi:arylsulfatase A-like enzyme